MLRCVVSAQVASAGVSDYYALFPAAEAPGYRCVVFDIDDGVCRSGVFLIDAHGFDAVEVFGRESYAEDDALRDSSALRHSSAPSWEAQLREPHVRARGRDLVRARLRDARRGRPSDGSDGGGALINMAGKVVVVSSLINKKLSKKVGVSS